MNGDNNTKKCMCLILEEMTGSPCMLCSGSTLKFEWCLKCDYTCYMFYINVNNAAIIIQKAWKKYN